MTGILPNLASLDGILLNVLPPLRAQAPSGQGVVVVLVSACPGEGVSYLTDALIGGLGRDGDVRVLRVDAQRLHRLQGAPEDAVEQCRRLPGGDADNLWELAPSVHAGTGPWESALGYRQACLYELRACFDVIVVDCPSQRESNLLLALAPLADGVILVVAADHTRRTEVTQAQRAIERADGFLLGTILNRRRYPVPAWLYRRL